MRWGTKETGEMQQLLKRRPVVSRRSQQSVHKQAARAVHLLGKHKQDKRPERLRPLSFPYSNLLQWAMRQQRSIKAERLRAFQFCTTPAQATVKAVGCISTHSLMSSSPAAHLKQAHAVIALTAGPVLDVPSVAVIQQSQALPIFTLLLTDSML